MEGKGSNYCVVVPEYPFMLIGLRYVPKTDLNIGYRDLKIGVNQHQTLLGDMQNQVTSGPLAKSIDLVTSSKQVIEDAKAVKKEL